MSRTTELDKNDLEVVKFIHYGGDPYNPPGYYAFLKFDGEIHQVLVSMASGVLDDKSD